MIKEGSEKLAMVLKILVLQLKGLDGLDVVYGKVGFLINI